LEPERQIGWMKEGVNFVIHSSDMAFFSQRLQYDLRLMKEAFRLGESLKEDSSFTV